MRVIAGSARRLLLKTPKGNDTRPTTDKTKETLFNVLMPYLGDATFLDLFSGSGGIGIEALSRGARNCVFVEKSREALSCINDNLKTTHFTEKSTVLKGDVLSNLPLVEKMGPFDLIFMDPPFDNGLEENVLLYLSNSKIVGDDSIIIVECSNDTDFSYVSNLGLEVFKIKQYKSHQHIFIRKAESE